MGRQLDVEREHKKIKDRADYLDISVEDILTVQIGNG